MHSLDKIKIKQYFEEAVRLNFDAPADLRDSLLRGHPRLEGFLDRLTDSVRIARASLTKKGVVLKEKTIQDFVYDLTKIFMQGLESEATKRYESDLQRIARQAKIDEKKEFDAVLAGEAVGEFAEAGVISNEEIDNQREAYINKVGKKQKHGTQGKQKLIY